MDYDDYIAFWTPHSGIGSLCVLERDDEKDIVTRLREVVAEVTGKPVAPIQRRIGFY